MQVKTLMKTPPVTVEGETPLAHARVLMRREGLSTLPVVRDEALVGVVTACDLRRAAPSTVRALRQWEWPAVADGLRVADVMQPALPIVTPETTAVDAARQMAATSLACLPVVDGATLLGTVSRRDLLTALLGEAETRRPAGFTAIVAITVPYTDDDPAVATGLALARGEGARLILLCHLPGSRRPKGVPAGWAARFARRRSHEAEAWLRRVTARHGDVEIVTEVGEGDLVQAALGTAGQYGADLIVLSRLRRPGLFGSSDRRSVERLIHAAPCPVLRVPDLAEAAHARA
jgi:CBS domain-containing protein